MLIDACCIIGTNSDSLPSAKELLRQMDQAGIDKAVIHPTDRCYAWENETGNNLLLDTAKEEPDRFIPTATVNPWRPDACDIINRKVDLGVKLLTFAPSCQGFVLSSHMLDPILEMLLDKKLRVPVYIHTGHHSNAAPSQLAMLARRFPTLNFIMGHSGATDYSIDVVNVCKANKNMIRKIPPTTPGRIAPGFDSSKKSP